METQAEMTGFVAYTSKTLVKYATKSKHILLTRLHYTRERWPGENARRRCREWVFSPEQL